MLRSRRSLGFIPLVSAVGAVALPAAGAVRAPGAYGGRDVQIAAAEFGLRRH
jgi:hypothetical protein